jgi:hypothetical protein
MFPPLRRRDCERFIQFLNPREAQARGQCNWRMVPIQMSRHGCAYPPTGIADVLRKPNLLYIPAHKPRLLEKIAALRSYIPTYMRPDSPGVTQNAGGRNRTNRGGLHTRRDHERGTAKPSRVRGAAFHRGAPTLGGLSLTLKH